MSSEIARRLQEFADDHVWIDRNYDTLLAKYAEQWIAVKNGEVIAHGASYEQLREKLADPAHTCIEFISREPLEMIL